MTFRTWRLLMMTTAGMALACNGDDKDEPDDTDDTEETDETDTDETEGPTGFTVTGMAIDIALQAPVTAGLCMELLDPSPAITGGEPTVLATATVGVAGAFTFEEVVIESTIGMLMRIDDCEGAIVDTVYRSSTGIPGADYASLTEGDTLDGVTAYSISATYLAGLEGSATAVGYAGDLGDDGFIYGFVLDTTATPISGATVTCASCTSVWYQDDVPADGLFSTGGAPNTMTAAAGGGVFVIPEAPVDSYSADDGGAHTFTSQLGGSNPGAATITAFFGE